MKKILFCLTVLWLTCTTPMLFAATQKSPLPTEAAFRFSLAFKETHTVLATWQIAPNYFLYANRTKLQLSATHPIAMHYPPAMQHNLYAGTLTVSIPLPHTPHITTLFVHYQGCADNAFCYPLIDRKFTIDTKNKRITEITSLSMANTHATGWLQPLSLSKTLLPLLTQQNQINNFMKNQSLSGVLFLFVILGLLLSFTPCVLPMIPILTAMIVGQKHKNSKQAFFLSFAYVLGMSSTYAGAGLLTAWLGRSLQGWLQQPIVILLASAIFFLLALSLFGLYELRLPSRLQTALSQWSNRYQGGTYISVFMMGLIATLIVSPCVTAPLLGVLLYIGQTGNLLLGGSALFMMGIGMGTPLLLIGTSLGTWLPKTTAWMKIIKIIFGLLMLCMAGWLIARVLPTATFQPTLSSKPLFITVRGLQAVKQQLLQAKTLHQPVLLDFYADWCESCAALDHHVFSNSTIQHALGAFTLVRADISQNTAEDDQLLKYFHVIAPPTILFFNASGIEQSEKRIVGLVNTKAFLTRLPQTA